MPRRPRRLHLPVEDRAELLRLWQQEIAAGRLFLPLTGTFSLYEPVVVRLTCDRWWLEFQAEVAAPKARRKSELGVGLNLMLHEEQELAIRLFAETSSVEELIRRKAEQAAAVEVKPPAEESTDSPSMTEVGKARLRSLGEVAGGGGFARAQASLRRGSIAPHLRRRQAAAQGESGVRAIVPEGFPSPQALAHARSAESADQVEQVVQQLRAYVEGSRNKRPCDLLGITEETLVSDGQLAFGALRDLLMPTGPTPTGHPSVSYWSEAAFEVLSRAWSLWSEAARERELFHRRSEVSGSGRGDDTRTRARKVDEPSE